ncbi:hypothetical protein [Viridibacillus arvi]|uniref:hypothetical protein n=1 Tax=Viridibacillus arvi TaxID=263475 RepID=UPI003D0529BB
MFTNVESTELISNVRNIMDELEKRYVEAQEKTEVDGNNVIQHKGLKLRKVEREVREGDYVKFFDSRSFSTQNNVIYGPAMKFETERELVVKCIDNVKVLIYKDVYNRTPSTVEVFEPIGYCKPLEYEPPFPEVLTPNQKRAVLIKQAKEFVEEHTQKTKVSLPKPLSKLKLGSKLTRGIGYKDYVVEEQFLSNAKKRTVVCLLRGVTSSVVRSKGISKCAPDDVFNEHIGQAIALGRALGLNVSEFEQVVKPNRRADGMVIEWRGGTRVIATTRVAGETCDFDSEFARYGTIIDDTNAEYAN